MNELWQWEERERELQDKMGKDLYHRLDRLIKLKEQEHITRDSSYHKEQDKEQERDQVNRDSFYLKEQKQDNPPGTRSKHTKHGVGPIPFKGGGAGAYQER